MDRVTIIMDALEMCVTTEEEEHSLPGAQAWLGIIILIGAEACGVVA